MQFKNFCRLNARTKRAFFELNALALIKMFRLWVEEADAKTASRQPPPHFNGLLERVMDFIDSVLSDPRVLDVDTLR